MLDVLLVGAEELENLGTRYLAAVLRQHGWSVELASFSTARELDAVVRREEAVRPRLVGLSVIFQYRAPEFLALAVELKRILPEVHITTGGHFATFTAAELLRDNAALDSVVRGEGEYTLLDLVQRLNSPEAWATVYAHDLRPGAAAHDHPNPNDDTGVTVDTRVNVDAHDL